MLLVLCFVVGLAVGAAGLYLYAVKKMIPELEQRMEDEHVTVVDQIVKTMNKNKIT